MAPELAFTAFLSHKYKAPIVNQFFFQLFSQVAQVQFEVDVGTIATNVTRLERLMQGADTFIGIYPLSESDIGTASRPELIKNSRYFRLELEIAARTSKPGLIFKDSRFRGIFSAPPPITEVDFDIQEILSGGEKPSFARFEQAFRGFCDRVTAARGYELVQERFSRASNKVGLLLPGEIAGRGYGSAQIQVLLAALNEARYKPIQLQWPPSLTLEWISQIRELNWIMIDIGAEAALTGIVGFLHGACVPAMRLRQVFDPTESTRLEESLYGGVEVGYAKDIIGWSDTDSLAAGVAARMASLDTPRRRIATREAALEYFQSAALRKEAVFVSYAGSDRDTASKLVGAMARRFQKVFDYRDGQSIRPGKPWLEEIFEQLAVSPIGVAILSSAYVKSGNCLHELRELIARTDNKEMRLFPVKLSADDSFPLPPELTAFQYIRLWEYSDMDKLVDWIVTNIPA